jgi:hypothetical protein
VIIVDNGPYIGYLTRAALLAADMVLIPTEAGAGGLAGIPQIIKEAEEINARHWRQIMIRVFVNNFQHTETFDINNLLRLKALVGSHLYNTYIPANTHLRKSKELGLPIHLIDKIAKTPVQGALAFRILAKNILRDLLPDFLHTQAAQGVSGRLKRLADTYQRQTPALHKAAPTPVPETAPKLPESQPLVAPPAAETAQAPARPQPGQAGLHVSPQNYTYSHESHGFGSLDQSSSPISTSSGSSAFSSRRIGEE